MESGYLQRATMRIGEILLEAKLVTPKQLADALEYGTSKRFFLGRAMTLLRYLHEEDVARALHTQKLIKMGLPVELAIEALQGAVKECISVERALQNKHPEKVIRTDARRTTVELRTIEKREDSPSALIRHGENLLLQDFCTQAEAEFKKALMLLEKKHGPDAIELAPVLIRLGNTYLAVSDFDLARESYERVLHIRARVLPDNHPDIAQTFESLADLYKAQGDEARATWAFLSALDVLEKALPNQLVPYALILRKLTRAMQRPVVGNMVPVGEILKLGGVLSADDLQHALKMAAKVSLPLGIVLRENCMVGDLEMQSALKAQFCIKQCVLPEQLAINLFARACRRGISLDRVLDEAGIFVGSGDTVDVYRQIAAELDALVAGESSEVNALFKMAPVAHRIGKLYEQVGDKTWAEVYYSRALTGWATVPLGDLTVAEACSSLAKILEGQGRADEVSAFLKKAMEHRKVALGEMHIETIQSIEDLAAAELELGNVGSSLGFVHQAITARERLKQDGTEILRSVVLVGDCMMQLKNYEAAQAAYKRAMGLAKPPNGQPTLALAGVMEKMGDLHSRQQMLRVAMPLYTSALLIMQAAGQRDSKHFEALQSKIALLEQEVKYLPAEEGIPS